MDNTNNRIQHQENHTPVNRQNRWWMGIAYYLSGRAFMEIQLGHRFESISLYPFGDDWDDGYDSHGFMDPQRQDPMLVATSDHSEVTHEVLRDLSGVAAEGLFRGRYHRWECFPWFDAIYRTLCLGMSCDKTFDFLEAQHRLCRDILSFPPNWALISRLAEEMMIRDKMSYSEVSDLFDQVANAGGNRTTLTNEFSLPPQSSRNGLSRYGKNILRWMIHWRCSNRYLILPNPKAQEDAA